MRNRVKIGIDVDNVINNLTECVISVYWERLQIKDGAADCIENLAKTNEIYFVTSTYPENVYRKAK